MITHKNQITPFLSGSFRSWKNLKVEATWFSWSEHEANELGRYWTWSSINNEEDNYTPWSQTAARTLASCSSNVYRWSWRGERVPNSTEWFSRGGPQPGATQKLIRKANAWVLPQSYWIRHAGGGSRKIYVLDLGPSSGSNAYKVWERLPFKAHL